jgi:hypothetical protein
VIVNRRDFLKEASRTAVAADKAGKRQIDVGYYYVGQMNMRTMLMLLVVACFVGCSSDDPRLNSGSNPPNSVTTSDDDIPSEVMSSWGRQCDFFREGNFTILGWEEAKAVLHPWGSRIKNG